MIKTILSDGSCSARGRNGNFAWRELEVWLPLTSAITRGVKCDWINVEIFSQRRDGAAPISFNLNLDHARQLRDALDAILAAVQS